MSRAPSPSASLPRPQCRRKRSLLIGRRARSAVGFAWVAIGRCLAIIASDEDVLPFAPTVKTKSPSPQHWFTYPDLYLGTLEKGAREVEIHCVIKLNVSTNLIIWPTDHGVQLLSSCRKQLQSFKSGIIYSKKPWIPSRLLSHLSLTLSYATGNQSRIQIVQYLHVVLRRTKRKSLML